MTESEDHREAVHGLFRWTCAFLILVAALLMLVQIGKKPFWVDESIAVLPARSIHTDFLPRNPFDLDFMPWQLEDDLWDPATPLYRYGVAAFTAVLGFSEATTRAFSVLMGLATAFVLYRLVRELRGPRTALLSATVLLTSTTFALHAREARHFTFVMFLATATLYCLHGAARRPEGRGAALWPLLAIATLLSQTLGYALLPVIAAWVFVLGPRGLLQRRWLWGYVAALAVYAGVIALFWNTLPFFHDVSCANRAEACHPNPLFYVGVLHAFLAPVEQLLGSPFTAAVSLAHLLAILGIASLVASGWRDASQREPIALLALWLLVPLVLLSTQEIKFPRYLFIWSMPVLAVLVAEGAVWATGGRRLDRGATRWLALMAVVIALQPTWRFGRTARSAAAAPTLALVEHVRTELIEASDDNWERIRYQARMVNGLAGPNDVVVTSFDDAGLYYYTGRFVYGFLDSKRNDAFFLDLLERTSSAGGKVWYIDTVQSWNFCLSDDPEPSMVDCRDKFPRFLDACKGSIRDLSQPCIRIPIR
jgi:4-amino-4-deoxy-L-arabinose transferase-like glycosyltransferase